MRRSIFLIASLGVLLTACTLPTRPTQPPPASSSAASSISSSSEPRMEEIFEDSGERAPTTEERTETGALLERLLPSGVLEVGNPSAPLTLLVFTEHHCSYCRQFLTEILPRLKNDYISAGTLKLRIAMLPLQKYPASMDAARGLLCASRQGKGFSMHTILFSNMNKTHDAQKSYAESLGMDTKAFEECFVSPDTNRLIKEQETWAENLAVSVVPVFFLNGEKMVGLPYYPDLRGKIEEALKVAKEQ